MSYRSEKAKLYLRFASKSYRKIADYEFPQSHGLQYEAHKRCLRAMKYARADGDDDLAEWAELWAELCAAVCEGVTP